MKWLCKLFGHDIKLYFVRGILPRTMKVVDRKVEVCKRGDLHKITDIEIGDYEITKGINLWGSSGVCPNCTLKETCKVSTLNKPWMMEHCPINSFNPLIGLESFKEGLSKWGDIIID